MHLTDFEDPSPALPCAGGLIAGTLALMTQAPPAAAEPTLAGAPH
jgi:hypothetical protein